MIKHALAPLFLIAQLGTAHAQGADAEFPRPATDEELAQCEDSNLSKLVVLDVDGDRTDPFIVLDCVKENVTPKTCGDLHMFLVDIPLLFKSAEEDGKLNAAQQLTQDSYNAQLGPSYYEHCVHSLS